MILKKGSIVEYYLRFCKEATLTESEIYELDINDRKELAKDTDDLEELRILADDPDSEVRQEATVNTHITDDLLTQLSVDVNDTVRELAIQYLKERGVAQEELTQLEEEYNTISNFLERIRDAGNKHQIMSLTYSDAKENMTTRRVEPYELRGNYFWAYNLDPESSIKGTRGIRKFRLDRLIDVRRGKGNFIPRWEIKVGSINKEASKFMYSYPQNVMDFNIYDNVVEELENLSDTTADTWNVNMWRKVFREYQNRGGRVGVAKKDDVMLNTILPIIKRWVKEEAVLLEEGELEHHARLRFEQGLINEFEYRFIKDNIMKIIEVIMVDIGVEDFFETDEWKLL